MASNSQGLIDPLFLQYSEKTAFFTGCHVVWAWTPCYVK